MAGSVVQRGTVHSAFAQVFCLCGWQLDSMPNGLLACKNPRCPERFKQYQVNVEVVEVEQKEFRV